MIGAIIGDMAASTREKDKETFFQQLIYPLCDSTPLQRLMVYCLELHKRPEWNNVPWYIDIFRDNENNAGLIDAIVVGWTASSIDECNEIIDRLFTTKEAWYARHYLAQLIFALRHGDTKRRATNVEHIGAFKNILNEHWKDESGPLGYLVRAWKCFESSFDFGSALHAAVELPGDMHMNCILVGTLADAMYGHQQYIRKRKFVSEGSEVQYIDIKLLDELKDFEQASWQNRTFFPKNNARTNVERHTWTSISIPSLEDIHFSKEARRRFLKSFYTGWDNRYGFYWDNGWFYVYRSFFLIGRFRLFKNKDGTYSISQIQYSDDGKDIKVAIEETIYPTLYSWDRFGDEDIKSTLLHMFKFFDPEVGNPGGMHFGNYFWLWESMVWENFEEKQFKKISDWWEQTSVSFSEKFPGFCSEELCLLDYFANMLAKWYPYANVDEEIKKYISF